jgi:arylsulfatase A-like enzyme
MKHCLFLIATILFSFPLFAQRTYGGSKPNIILIVADDLGYGDVGCYGQRKITTPHIDRLASSGLRFRQFYAGTSVCAPSRASLMMGLHTGHTPIRGNRGFQPEGQYPLPEDAVTMPQLLQELGYYTAAFGKWGMGYPGSTGVPEKQGFNRFYGYLCQSLAHNYYPDHLWDNGTRIDFPFNIGKDSLYAGDYIHQQAISFLQQQHEQPYFLFLPYTLPHGDLDLPKDSTYWRYVKQFGEDSLPHPGKLRNAKDRHEPYPHAAFAAMVSRLDRYVGEVVNAVKASGMSNNTLILFTSDNGPHREDGGDPEFFNSSGGLRGIKRDLYEGGIRVPTIAYWPGTIKQGVTNQTGAFWDLFPTFMELAGLPLKGDRIDGISLAPTLLGKGKQVQHPFFYWEFHENNGRQAVRMGKWKGVWYNVGLKEPQSLQLFNLDKDPFEKEDVAAKNPSVVAEIKSIIAREHVGLADWPLLFAERKQ